MAALLQLIAAAALRVHRWAQAEAIYRAAKAKAADGGFS